VGPHEKILIATVQSVTVRSDLAAAKTGSNTIRYATVTVDRGSDTKDPDPHWNGAGGRRETLVRYSAML